MLVGNRVEPGLISSEVVTIAKAKYVSCAWAASFLLPIYYARLIGYVSCVIEREDYCSFFFCNILMIFLREYNGVVLVPTPGWIKQNQ